LIYPIYKELLENDTNFIGNRVLPKTLTEIKEISAKYNEKYLRKFITRKFNQYLENINVIYLNLTCQI